MRLRISTNGSVHRSPLTPPFRHSYQVRVLYQTLGFFFCKVARENPWSQVAVFWAYFKKYGCLLGKSDKRLRFFIYVRHILQCIDWHSVCSQLIANQCNNICLRVICHMFCPSLKKNHIQKEGAWRCNPSDDRSRRRGEGWLSFSLFFFTVVL